MSDVVKEGTTDGGVGVRTASVDHVIVELELNAGEVGLVVGDWKC